MCQLNVSFTMDLISYLNISTQISCDRRQLTVEQLIVARVTLNVLAVSGPVEVSDVAGMTLQTDRHTDNVLAVSGPVEVSDVAGMTLQTHTHKMYWLE